MPRVKKKSKKINVYLNHSERLSIYGLNESQINELKQVALERYGKASISLLVRESFKQEIAKQQNVPDTAAYEPNSPKGRPKKRLVIRLPAKLDAYLVHQATLRNESFNGIVNYMLAEYMKKNPALSNDEVEAVYESIPRLRGLGEYLNEIARKLNAGESVSLSTAFINKINQQVFEHVDVVNNMLLKKRQRFQKFLESLDNPPGKGQ